MKNSSFPAVALLFCFILSANVVFSQEAVEARKDLADKFSMLINRADVCEAYPYLSADGLRLYFTTDREGGHGRLYFCSRNSITENFSAPKPLSQHLPDGYYAATLTADELTIFASYKGKIYSSIRSSTNDQFIKPTVVEGLAEGWKFAPSISQDGHELIICLDGASKRKDIAIHYRKNITGGFIEVNRFNAPAEVDLDPGQFSKDGLSFYASYEVKNPASVTTETTEKSVNPYAQKIIRFTRASLQDNFTISEDVPGLNSPLRNHQPTMNEDETIFVVANSTADSWSKNDLKLVNLKQDRITEIFKKIMSPGPLVTVFDSINICGLRYSFPGRLDSRPFDCYKYLSLDLADTVIPGCVLQNEKFDDLFVFPLILLDSITTEAFDVCDFTTDAVGSTIELLPENNVQVKVYPNPFVNDLIITIDKTDLNPRFDLYDISGRKIFTTKLKNLSNKIQFNQPGSGVYIYKIMDKSGKVISTGKLVKK